MKQSFKKQIKQISNLSNGIVRGTCCL